MVDVLKINYTRHRLENGLEVILYPDNALPVVAANLWYRVGSANETKGKTGFAHLFEHMMFQGSKNVAKQMHFRYIQEAGGSLNGSTSLDRTNYFQTVPSNYLELVLWLESDRMGFLLPALTQEKLDNQIDVVKNERRQRYDNAPYGLAWQILNENMYPDNHPYHWPTIGYMDDISNISLEDVRSFFKKYYTPDNASLVIAGDIRPEYTMELVERYFGPIRPSGVNEAVPAPAFSIAEERHIVHKDKVQLPRIYMAWHTGRSYSEDEPALDHLAQVLAGSKSARLYRDLVFERQMAQSISAFQHSAKRDGMFIIVATPKPGVSVDELKTEIQKHIEKVISAGIDPPELQRSKNGIKSAFIFSMQNIGSIADHINGYNYHLTEPDSFNFDMMRYQQTSEYEIRAAAEKYLSKPFVRLDILPE